MTVLASFYTMDNKDGVDLNFIQTSVGVTTDPSIPAPRAKLGDRVQGNGGSEWIFVQASATVTAYNVVAIDSNFKAANATIILAASQQYVFGIAEFPPNQLGSTVSIGNAAGGVVNTGDFFWAALKIAAGGKVNCATTAALGAKLFVNGLHAGSLTSGVSVTSPIIYGVNSVETLTTISVPQSVEVIMQGYLMGILATA
jgi:hypothetical protein